MKLIFFPFNGNMKEALSVYLRTQKSSVNQQDIFCGFIDDNPKTHGQTFGTYSVLGGREQLSIDSFGLVASPGRPENFRSRPALLGSLHPKIWQNLIDPTVVIGPECSWGKNCILMPGVVLTANVTIGDHVTILANTVIHHDSNIGSYSIVGSNVTIAGSVRIGENCYVASGSRIKDNVNIGNRVLIGMGSIVLADVESEATVYGVVGKKRKAYIEISI